MTDDIYVLADELFSKTGGDNVLSETETFKKQYVKKLKDNRIFPELLRSPSFFRFLYNPNSWPGGKRDNIAIDVVESTILFSDYPSDENIRIIIYNILEAFINKNRIDAAFANFIKSLS